MIPKNPLNLRKVVTREGDTPPGSCGWGYCFPTLNDDVVPKTWLISDAYEIGVFWPLQYDEANDCLVATGDGFKVQGGKIVETYPLGGDTP